ncbi:hypothetical protein RIF29_18720 [Crotalaria pallida]|uniref:Uncharacterized protein n=1 Tax=Crotalaria pallida TaxID=3830 RepID=A0AAN9I726_CROPI
MFAIPTHIKAWTYSEYGNSAADIVVAFNAKKSLQLNLVSKWKRIVDEWVKLKTPGQAVTDVMADEDSPDQKTPYNEHHQYFDDCSSTKEYSHKQLDNLKEEFAAYLLESWSILH